MCNVLELGKAGLEGGIVGGPRAKNLLCNQEGSVITGHRHDDAEFNLGLKGRSAITLIFICHGANSFVQRQHQTIERTHLCQAFQARNHSVSSLFIVTKKFSMRHNNSITVVNACLKYISRKVCGRRLKRMGSL